MTPLLAHADWSVSPAKRWMTVAEAAGDGWRVRSERVGPLVDWLDRLRAAAAGAPVLLGVDAPIGLPLAVRAGRERFVDRLRALTPESAFFQVCQEPGEIGPDRPFYPARSSPGVRRQPLLDGLGVADGTGLLRRCEGRLGPLPAASPMFWTLGANQVGKGAIVLWRDVLLPALHGPDSPSIWPFDGPLAELLRPGCLAVAETYPANALRQLGLAMGGSKRRQADRLRLAPALLDRLGCEGATPDGGLHADIADGFGAGADGEDRFDSFVGLLRMLQIVREGDEPALPIEVREWEGWILGRPLSFP